MPARLLATCVVALLAIAPGLRAQNGEPAPSEAAPPRKEPGPIAAADVAGQSAEVEALLRALPRAADPGIEDVEKELKAFEENAETLASQATEQHVSEVAPVTLAKLQTQWRTRAELVKKWNDKVAERAGQLNEELEKLAALRAQWEKTREAAAVQDLPAATVQRVRDTLAEIREAERATKERRDTVLTLQERVAGQQRAITDVLELLEARASELRQQLLAYDSPALWTAVANPDAFANALTHVRAFWRSDFEASTHFIKTKHRRLVIYAVLLAALMGLTSLLSTPARHWAEEDPALEASARVLERPWSSALLVALLIVVMTLPDAPLFPPLLTRLLVPLPVLRLLIPLLTYRMRRALYALTAWYYLDEFRFLLVGAPLVARLTLLFECLAVILVMLWLLKPARLARMESIKQWHGAVAIAGRLTLLVLGVAVLANVLGNVSLADVLTSGTLLAGYLILVFSAAGRALSGIYTVLLRTRPARLLRIVRRHTPLLQRRGIAAIRFALTALWVYLTLSIFEVKDIVFDGLWNAMGTRWTVGNIDVSLGDFVAFGLAVYAAFPLSRFVRFILGEELLPRTSLPRGVPYAITSATHYAILLVGFLFAVRLAGVDMSQVVLVIGALGVGIGIGLQDVVNNFVSGVILLVERPVKPGDTIEVGSLLGEVRRIGIRSSTVRTFQGAEVIVPNARLVSDQLVNWTLSDQNRRLEIPVGVAYGTDPERVLQLLLATASAHPAILGQPEPSALFVGFGDSSLDFQVRAWTDRVDIWRQVQSELTVAINAAIRDAKIEIPFPQRDLHVRSVDPSVRRSRATKKDG
jgi:potassium efflux system protein